MGLFDFLFGGKPDSRVEVMGDHVWMTQQAKLNGIRNQLESRCVAGAAAVVLVAHFADTLELMQALAAGHSGGTHVAAMLAGKLRRDALRPWNLGETTVLDIIVCERHPSLDMDEKFEQLLEELPCRCRLSYHLSLEDPLLRRFAGEWVGGILEKLGMSEHEAIESDLVRRRVKAAQKKIQAEALGFLEEGSAAQWVEKNLRDTSAI